MNRHLERAPATTIILLIFNSNADQLTNCVQHLKKMAMFGTSVF